MVTFLSKSNKWDEILIRNKAYVCEMKFCQVFYKIEKKMCDKRWPHKSCADDDGEEGGTYDLG